jgi:hypothetical protein
MKVVMIRIIKKMNLTLDKKLLITTEETQFDIENSKMDELIRAGMAITDATLDREKRDEREVASMKKELDNLRYQAKYYHNSKQVVVLLKCEF